MHKNAATAHNFFIYSNQKFNKVRDRNPDNYNKENVKYRKNETSGNEHKREIKKLMNTKIEQNMEWNKKEERT